MISILLFNWQNHKTVYQKILGALINREITAQTGHQWAVQTLAFFWSITLPCLLHWQWMLPLAFCLSTGKIRRQYQEIVGTLIRETVHSPNRYQWAVQTLTFFFIYHASLLTPLTMTLPLAFCLSTGKTTRQYQEILGTLNREITA